MPIAQFYRIYIWCHVHKWQTKLSCFILQTHKDIQPPINQPYIHSDNQPVLGVSIWNLVHHLLARYFQTRLKKTTTTEKNGQFNQIWIRSEWNHTLAKWCFLNKTQIAKCEVAVIPTFLRRVQGTRDLSFMWCFKFVSTSRIMMLFKCMIDTILHRYQGRQGVLLQTSIESLVTIIVEIVV